MSHANHSISWVCLKMMDKKPGNLSTIYGLFMGLIVDKSLAVAALGYHGVPHFPDG